MKRARWTTAWSGAAAVAFTVALSGCRSVPSAIVENPRVVYRFENVRQVGEFDEWPHILDVLASHAVSKEPPVKVEASAARVAGPMRVQDYRAELTVARLSDIDAIQGELDRLAQERFGKETIDTKIVGATAELRYRSAYVVAGVEIDVSGLTDPNATLTIVLHDGTEQTVQVAADGSWRTRIKIAPNRRRVYGFSTDRAGGARKYFRVDVYTQQQEPVPAADFVRLQSAEP